MPRSDHHVLGFSRAGSEVTIRFSDRYVNKLRRDYGITPAEFEIIVTFQRGCCPVCLEELGIDMYVDHNHSHELADEHGRLPRVVGPLERRKLVRGIVHFACNVLLGRIEKYPWLVSDHIQAYIDKPPAQEVLSVVSPSFPTEAELRSRKGRGGRKPAKHRFVNGKEYRYCRHHKKWHSLSKWRIRKQGEYTLYNCRERSRELKRMRSQKGGVSSNGE